MSTTKHREVAKLDRVPLPVEAARIGATGWQITRTGARVVTKLAGRGSLQQKIIKQIPQTFVDLGPTYVKFGQIIASSPGAFGESLSREFRSLLDAVPPADTERSAQAVQGGARRRAVQAVQDASRTSPSRRPRSRRCTTRRCTAARRSSSRSSGPASAAASPPTCRSSSAARSSSSWPSWAGGCPPRTSSPTSPTTSPRSSTSGSRRSRWTRGCRTCTPRRWARTSGCRRCTGTTPPSGC